MTDKQRLIDATKLIERFRGGGVITFSELVEELESGRIDPDPPQQPDIQVGARNWQEDMKLCERYGDSDIPYNASEFSVALPYWLQQYAALEREYERFQKAASGWNDDLTKAEAEIEQKDAEIARLKKSIEGLRMLHKATRATQENTP